MNHVKKFVGRSMDEILSQIKSEMGDEAVIYQSSTKKNSFNGMSQFEVIAGVDEYPQRKPKIFDRTKAASVAVPVKPPIYKPEFKNIDSSSSAPVHHEPIKKEQQDDLIKENFDLKAEIKGIKDLIKTLIPHDHIYKNDSLRKARSHMLNNGIEPELADEYIYSLKDKCSKYLDRMSHEQIMKVLKYTIQKKFDLYQKKLPEQRIKMLIGPTGAGKTTTIAKLASQAVLKQKKQAAFISLDSYKLGAHHQLRAYANILNSPFFAVSTIFDMKKTIQGLSEDVQIFIDTTGISPNNEMGILKISNFVNKSENVLPYLVISATNNQLQMKRIIDSFQKTQFKRLILTKIDELASFGHLLNLTQFYHQPIDYITNGQEVPHDILTYQSQILVDQIVRMN